jgi:hypothetical protein
MGLLDRFKGKRAQSRADGRSDQPKDSPGTRRVIKTARTLEDINTAARQGLRPLVKPVRPSKDIHYMVAVFQDPKTGEIELSGDVREDSRGYKKGKVLDYMLYYPYHFPNPFAAYLVPTELTVGEEVWLEDVIEDLVAVFGNQGYQPRLEAAPAVWTGDDFEILFDPRRDADHWIG